jgi:uncharacterized membrane protein
VTVRRALLAATVALAAWLALTGAAFGRSADVVDADIEMKLAPDASLLVTENLTFDYDGSFEGSYRDILLLHGERITDVRVSEGGQTYQPGGNTILGSHDRPGVYGVSESPGMERIVWHYRASDEERTYAISYRVIGAAVAYDDVIDVGWAVWGDQWDFDLEHLTASFTDRALDPADDAYRVWGHPRGVEGETVRGDGTSTLEATDIDSGTAVEMRVTVPRTPGQNVSGAREGSGDGLLAIVAAEQELDDEFNAPWPTFKRWVADHAVAIALALLALAIVAIVVLRLLARERPTATPEYLPEPPDDASPALAYGLAHEGGDSNNTVLATLLDLTERGYYTTNSANTEDEELDLALAKSARRPTKDGLQPHEQEVLEFFDELLEDDTVPMSEMRERIPQHSSSWRARWNSMTSALDSADEGALDWDRDLRPAKRILALVVLALFTAVTWIDISIDEAEIVPGIIGLITLIVVVAQPSSKLRRMRAADRERSARWQAFEEWTKDFPRLKDDPPATLELWKRILVYGVAFGTAERMIESGRIPAPVAESAGADGHWTTYAFAGGLADNSFDGGAFSSGFASQVAPPASSSTGGGGGFSGGGGGGFSGGGGGGSW